MRFWIALFVFLVIPSFVSSSPSAENDGAPRNPDSGVSPVAKDESGKSVQTTPVRRALKGKTGFYSWRNTTIESDNTDCVYCVDNYQLHYFGGPTARGSRAGDQTHLVQTAPTGGTGISYYTASSPVSQTNSGDQGTNTGSGARGGYYAINPIVKCQGANLYVCSAAELDIMVKSGTTSKHLFGLAVSDFAAEHGAVTDAAIVVYSGAEQPANLGGGPWGPGAGRNNGILFAELEHNGLVPLSPSATILGGSVTSLRAIPVANGIDLRTFSVSGNAFASNGFAVSGTGAATAVSLKLSKVSVSALPSCSAELEGTLYSVVDANSASFNAPISGGGSNHVMAYCSGTGWTVH